MVKPTLLSWIAVAVLSVAPLCAAPLAPEDIQLLESRAKKISAAFNASDVDGVVEMTHPSLFQVMGGKEKMAAVTQALMAKLKADGVELVESELGIPPTEGHPAGDELVCFYPRTIVWRYEGKKVKSTSFFICVRKADGGEWLFLDGSGLQDQPGLLQRLLPALSAEVKLPENKAELLE